MIDGKGLSDRRSMYLESCATVAKVRRQSDECRVVITWLTSRAGLLRPLGCQYVLMVEAIGDVVVACNNYSARG